MTRTILNQFVCNLLPLIASGTVGVLSCEASNDHHDLFSNAYKLASSDDTIDAGAKALYLAAFTKRTELKRIEIEADVKVRSWNGAAPFTYHAIEYSAMDLMDRRYFFQQEMEILESSQGSKSEYARILIRDGIRYQKMSRNQQDFSINTLKSDAHLESINAEIQMFNFFLLGVSPVSSSDFGPAFAEKMHDFVHVKSLRFGKSIAHEGTIVQELVFQTTFLGELNWYVWVDRETFRIHRVDIPGVHLITSWFDAGNDSVFPNRVEIAEFREGRQIAESSIKLTRLDLNKEFRNEDFSIQRIKPVLNDYVTDYDQSRIVGRWNGHSYLGEEPIKSPAVEAAIIEQRLAGQASIPWLTYVIWTATAIVAVYLLVRWTRPRSKTV